ncbi:MAG: hypothetical protein ACRDKJ_11020 [Actinomycetota bacterium]
MARVRLAPEAESDLAEAHVWYEEARSGVGDLLLEAFSEAI